MHKSVTLGLATASMLLAGAVAMAQTPSFVLYNGKIVTLDPKSSVVSAIAVAGDRIDRFSTFIACGWPTPTLPMLALQAAHPGAYATLREAVLRAHEDDAALLPVFDPDAMTRGVLEAAALQLRRLIQNRPGDTASLPPDDMAATLQRYYAEPDLHLFNHYGPPGTFEHWSYADVLARARSDPGSLRRSFQGRVVFIGYAEFTRPEQTEHFPTPFLGRESIAVSGVELLATAYSNLLRASTLRTADHAAWVAVTTAVLTTLACLLLPAFWGLLVPVLPPCRPMSALSSSTFGAWYRPSSN